MSCRREDELSAAGVLIPYLAERVYTRSFYQHDPDGNEVESKVDTSDAWTSEAHAPGESVRGSSE